MDKSEALNKEIFESAPIGQAVRYFVLPSMASTMITIIYSLADTLFLGMLGEPVQVAGLTVAFPYFQFLNAIASLWGVGANSVMARSLGEKRYEYVSKVSMIGFWGALVFMLCCSALCVFFEEPLLNFAGANSATYGYAASYLFWTFIIGGVPMILSITLCNLLRSEGHAKKASQGLMLGGFLNCLLDPLFIFGFDMGVAGVAIATMLSNCAALVYFLIYYAKIRGTTYITLNPLAYKFEGKGLGEIILSGLPSCCLTLLGATGCIVQTSLYALYSDFAVAGWGVVNRICYIGIFMTHGVAQGVLPLIGYNFGAKNYQRVQAANRHVIGIMLAISLALTVISEVFSEGIVRIFINDAETIRAGARIMRLYMLSTPFMSMILLTSTLCQAVGKWQYSLGMLSVRQLFFNVPLTFFLSGMFGLDGVAMGQPTCDVICLFMAGFVYYHCFIRALRKPRAV